MEVDKKRSGLVAVAVVFDDSDGYPPSAPPGQYQVLSDRVWLLSCPGCGHLSSMRCGTPKPSPGPSWEVSGTAEAPSLHPSINCIGCCGWHGYLKNGVFDACKD